MRKGQGARLTCSHVVLQSLSCNRGTHTHMGVPRYEIEDDLVDDGSSENTDTWSNWAPLRLNRRVNVLPQPGTGQAKWASFLRLLALAACVADVVTCFFSTCKIGGRRVMAVGEV